MFYDDHNPPHLHAWYGRAKALVRLSDGMVIAGELPPTATRLVRDWTLARRADWKRIGDAPGRNSHWSEFVAQMQMADFPMVDVLRLRPLEGYRLWLRFSDGREGVRDLSVFIAEGGPMVEPLKDASYFARAFVEMGAPTWPNGFDLDPINLYMELRDSGALKTTEAAE